MAVGLSEWREQELQQPAILLRIQDDTLGYHGFDPHPNGYMDQYL